ncbi:transposase [Streptomyces sp. NPDC007355]|uniref:transposase n=1 Tax=Streptomyces sp. NPDC007355 TaxID=3364778 RepID=UPI0036C2E628
MVFIDAIRVKICEGAVANRPIYVALVVTVECHEILGLRARDGGEGAKHWMHILTEIKSRGVNDVLMLGLRRAERPARRGRDRLVEDDRADLCGPPTAEFLPLCRPPGLGQDR